MNDKPTAFAARAFGGGAAPLPREESPRASLEVPVDRLVQDWKKARDRATAYLTWLGVPPGEHDALAREAVECALAREHWPPDSDAVRETLHALRTLLPKRFPSALRSQGSLDEFAAWRLEAALSRRFDGSAGAPPSAGDPFTSMPTPKRGHMVPEKIERRFFRRLLRGLLGRGAAAGDIEARKPLRRLRKHFPWIRAARRRRVLLGVLVLIPSVVASGFMLNVLPRHGSTWIEIAIVFFFGALFGWISIGFWTALFGFFILLGRRDRFAITNLAPPDGAPIELDRGARTAIVMPICEEPVDRVFAGLQAIYQSVERTGTLDHFDFFVLSDSTDPDTWVKEEEAWFRWCRAVDGFRKIYYRRRRVRLHRKSGNVADFCRRWGKAYRYMIMLDADSVMSGNTLARLVYLMEHNPDVGMIQTAPRAVNRNSLFARVQQFAIRVYGPMFAAGLHYWQLGDGQYWGHNTIIRIAPFMHHCALPRLPGRPPLGGEILSHDFVEAALMGRAGWTLWLAFDLTGSYEEVPSTLLEEMKRDRRWCQGNLQHLRLLFTEGLFGAHRALFLNGVLGYVSALLWFAFLSLSTAEAIINVLAEYEYFPHGPSLFPEWPIWRPEWAYALLAVTGCILFLPKVLSVVLLIVKERQTRLFGGVVRLTLSALFEILLSSLLAPIRMVFHSRFVVQNVLGRTVVWRSQGREDAETSWREAIRHHGFDTLFASAWGASLYWLNPDYFWWVTPIIGALILSIPTSVLASRVSLGEHTRRWGLFLISEERVPPPELRDLATFFDAAQRQAALLPPAQRKGFGRAAVDPYVNALRRALARGPRSLRPSIRAARRQLIERALVRGPAGVDTKERRVLLSDPDSITAVHERAWEIADPYLVDRRSVEREP